MHQVYFGIALLLTLCGVNVVFAIDGLWLDSQGLWLVRLGFSLGWGEVNGVEKDHRLWVTQLTLLRLNGGWMDAGVIPLVAQIKSGQKKLGGRVLQVLVPYTSF